MDVIFFFGHRRPIAEYPFYMLLETSGSNQKHDEEKLIHFLELAIKRGTICDGMTTGEASKVAQIWQLREWIPLALKKEKYCFTYDITLPISYYYDIVPMLSERIGDLAYVVCGFGHLGDSNLHVHVLCDEYSDEVLKRIEPFIYEYTIGLKGSISAEHGIGFLKKKYLKKSKSIETIELMKQLKTLMDPHGILNPYKVLLN